MAVTITSTALAAAIRLGDSAEETAEVSRLLLFATETITKYAPLAPDVVQNEACVRLCAFLFDMPYAARDGAFANSMRNSGAGRMLLPYRVHRAGSTAEAVEAAQQAVGTVANPVIGVAVVAGELVVTFADGTSHKRCAPRRRERWPAGRAHTDALGMVADDGRRRRVHPCERSPD